VVNGAIYLIAQTTMLRNKPTTIAMSSICGLTLAHTANPITPQCTRLHWRTPNQTRTQLLFYSCLAD